MNEQKPLSALVALHGGKGINFSTEYQLKCKDFLVHTVDTSEPSADKVLEKLGFVAENNTPEHLNHKVCIMEANLGYPGKDTIEPLSQIYQYARPYHERGELYITGVSGTPDVVRKAKEAGLPCINKDLVEITDFINSLQP